MEIVLWELLDNDTSVNVPLYLKYLLQFQGFDSVLSFKYLNDDTIDKLENSARVGLKYLLVSVMGNSIIVIFLKFMH